MGTTLEQQARAIRSGIKALEFERRKMREREIAGDAVADVIAEIDGEIAALRDAVEALKAAAAFRTSLKEFINA